jgi:hypothetical protein
MPPPRQEAPMTPGELKRTTDVLLSDRNKLSAEAQAATATGSLAPPATGQPPAAASPQKTGTGARP